MRTISVVIPVLNEEKYITSCLERFKNQTISKKDYFLVIVDNGSTDSTLDKIKKFKEKNSGIAIEIISEKSKGIGPARTHGLSTSVALGAKRLISTDADTLIGKDFILESVDILKKDKNNVVKGRIDFSKRFMLFCLIHFKKMLVITSVFRNLNTKLFGPVVNGPFMGFNSELYNKIYLGDIYDPLITEEDYLLSRRAYYLGAEFVTTNTSVLSSERRVLGNLTNWLAHTRISDYKETYSFSDIIPPTKRQIKTALNKRIKTDSDKIIRTLTDAMFISSLTNAYQPTLNKTLSKAKQLLKIHDHDMVPVHYENRMTAYSHLRNTYLNKVIKQVTTYIVNHKP